MALKHLRSSTADKRPQASGMTDGQLAVNTASGSPGLFFKDSAGSLVKVGPVHVGSGAPNATPASGGTSGNSLGEQWLDTSGGTYVFKIWDGSAWRSEAGEFVNTTGDTMTGALGIIAGSASTPGLFFSGDTNTGIYSPGADQVAVATSGAGRVFVDASGNVTINGQGDLRFADSDSSNWVAFQAPATVASDVTYTLPSADGTNGQVLSTNGSGTLSWATASGGASVTTSDTAPASPSDGDLWYDSVGGRTYVYYQDPNGSQWVDASPQGGGGASLWTQGSGTVTPTTSTDLVAVNGVKFPATQVASGDANVLDDYEEGTWTPVVIGTSTAGTASYGQQHGVYTKIGRLVQFSMYLDWSSGTGTGNLRLSGLPFTSNSSSAGTGCSIGFFYSLTFSASHFLIANVGAGGTYIEIRQGPVGGANDSPVGYDSNAGIQITGVYCI